MMHHTQLLFQSVKKTTIFSKFHSQILKKLFLNAMTIITIAT